MKYFIHIIICLFLSCMHHEEPIESVNDMIRKKLSSEGYSTHDIEFHDNFVIVEGDIEFDKQELLKEQGNHNKAYRFSRLVSQKNVANINLYFDGISSKWQEAFLKAIEEWNDITNSKIFIKHVRSASEPYNLLTIKYHHYTQKNKFAAGWPPRKGSKEIGKFIRLNSNYKGGENAIEEIHHEVKIKIALHEIGHTLGFAHPGEAKYIDGTSNATYHPDYPTVMRPGWFKHKNLFTDDKHAAVLIYPIDQ